MNLGPLIDLLIYTRGCCSPYQNIHVALDFYHVQLEVTAQIVTYFHAFANYSLNLSIRSHPKLHKNLKLATLVDYELNTYPKLLLFQKQKIRASVATLASPPNNLAHFHF